MGEVERVEGERLLARGDRVRDGDRRKLAEYMAYCCAVRGNRETTVAGKLVAVNFFHEQWVGRSLPLKHFRIKAVKEGIKRSHVEGGYQQRVRRPLTWEMVKGMEEVAQSWGVGGRIAWIGLALTYLLLLRASELYAEDDGKVYAVNCLKGRDVAFFAGERQIMAGDSPGVDTVEVRFRGSKGDQGRKGAVLVRTKGDGGGGGEAVELLQELYQIHGRRGELPLMAFHSARGW